MTPEQLLVVAREFCPRYRVSITDFAALAAASAAAHARIDGIEVHDGPQRAAAALEKVLRAVPALSGHNAEFGRLCKRIYLQSAELR